MLRVDEVTVRFGDRVVLDGTTLEVDDGEIVAILGASGSGKSTLLRVVAGLLLPDAGTVAWDGVDLAGVPPHLRRFGLMFQDNQLFPHRDVGQNVAFGLRMQHAPKASVATRVSELLGLVGLAGYEQRKVATLSGGEAQRVALARSLAPAPRLLMLDEPLGALDRELHDRLAVDVRALLKRLGTTAIHVTHDHEEAAVVADRVVRLGGVAAS
jgi:thiamine transport system ATP-binding protein